MIMIIRLYAVAQIPCDMAKWALHYMVHVRFPYSFREACDQLFKVPCIGLVKVNLRD